MSLEVYVFNTTVERYGHFEIRARFFPINLTNPYFDGIICGYKQHPDILIPLTKWDRFRKKMVPEFPLPVDYQGRLSTVDTAVMRINNANFRDEGTYFYCRLSFYNTTSGGLSDVIKSARLETVYGEHKTHSLIYNTMLLQIVPYHVGSPSQVGIYAYLGWTKLE